MTDLLTRLRQLARAEHDDLDIGDEAAEEIINLRVDVHVLREMLERYKRDAERCRELREALEMMVEMIEMNGFGRAYAMDVARAALAQGQGGSDDT